MIVHISLNIAPRVARAGYVEGDDLRHAFTYEPVLVGIQDEGATDADVVNQASFLFFNSDPSGLKPIEQNVLASYLAAGNRPLAIGDVVTVCRATGESARYAITGGGTKLLRDFERVQP